MDTDNLTVTVINKNFSRSYRVYCTTCKLICGIVWYVSTDDDAPRYLCVDCYNSMDSRETASFVRTDILKKVESNKDSKISVKTNWGLEDNIKLLEFMGNC
jgi:hypothetical protein